MQPLKESDRHVDMAATAWIMQARFNVERFMVTGEYYIFSTKNMNGEWVYMVSKFNSAELAQEFAIHETVRREHQGMALIGGPAHRPDSIYRPWLEMLNGAHLVNATMDDVFNLVFEHGVTS